MTGLADKEVMLWRLFLALCSGAGLFVVFTVMRFVKDGTLEPPGGNRKSERETQVS